MRAMGSEGLVARRPCCSCRLGRVGTAAPGCPGRAKLDCLLTCTYRGGGFKRNMTAGKEISLKRDRPLGAFGMRIPRPTRTPYVSESSDDQIQSVGRLKSQNPHLCRKERGKDGAPVSFTSMKLPGF